MNTIRSTWLGWGALCVAGGGAYYFAKKSVNADRAARHEAEMKRKAQLAAMEHEHRQRQEVMHQTPRTATTMTTPAAAAPPQQQTVIPVRPTSKRAEDMGRFQSSADDVASPSAEAGHDPAPTRHEPETDAERIVEKGKYEAAVPFRPPRGNRFS